MISVKNVLVALAVAFTAYLAARGLWWTEAAVPYPLIVVATLGMYLATTWLCIFWDPAPSNAAPGEEHIGDVHRTRGRLPVPAMILALAAAVVVPSAISFAVGPGSVTSGFATWYLGGIGALMTIVMVRRRPWAAWAGIVILAVGSMAWMGPANALALGLVGSIVWVTCAQLLVGSLDRAARDTSRLAQLQRAASAWQASQVGRQREHVSALLALVPALPGHDLAGLELMADLEDGLLVLATRERTRDDRRRGADQAPHHALPLSHARAPSLFEIDPGA